MDYRIVTTKDVTKFIFAFVGNGFVGVISLELGLYSLVITLRRRVDVNGNVDQNGHSDINAVEVCNSLLVLVNAGINGAKSFAAVTTES